MTSRPPGAADPRVYTSGMSDVMCAKIARARACWKERRGAGLGITFEHVSWNGHCAGI